MLPSFLAFRITFHRTEYVFRYVCLFQSVQTYLTYLPFLELHVPFSKWECFLGNINECILGLYFELVWIGSVGGLLGFEVFLFFEGGNC